MQARVGLGRVGRCEVVGDGALQRCDDVLCFESSRTRLPSNGRLMGGGMVDGAQSFSSDARKVILASVPEVALLS